LTIGFFFVMIKMHGRTLSIMLIIIHDCMWSYIQPNPLKSQWKLAHFLFLL